MKKGIIFFAIGMMFLSSCSKSKQEILTSTTWMIESFNALNQNYVQDCMLDDYFYFNSSGKVQWIQNGTKCDQTLPIPITPDFTLADDSKTITLSIDLSSIGFGKQTIPLTVDELTETRMRASSTGLLSVSVSFVAKK